MSRFQEVSHWLQRDTPQISAEGPLSSFLLPHCDGFTMSLLLQQELELELELVVGGSE